MLTPEQSQMVEDNIKLAYYALRKYRNRFNWLEEEEIMSACFLGLIKAVIGYNPELGTAFSTYAMTAMYHTIIRELIPRKQVIEPIYLEELINEKNESFWQTVMCSDESLEDEVIHSVLSEQIMTALDNIKMGKTYKAIIRTHYHEPDLSQMEIAERLGCKQKTVSLAYGEARKKLRPMVCMG